MGSGLCFLDSCERFPINTFNQTQTWMNLQRCKLLKGICIKDHKMDLKGYEQYLNNELQPYEMSVEEIKDNMLKLDALPKASMANTGRW